MREYIFNYSCDWPLADVNALNMGYQTFSVALEVHY